MLILAGFVLAAGVGCAIVPPPISHAGLVLKLSQRDRQAVLNLLRTAQFSQLNAHYVGLQQQYETGLITDRDLTLQYQAFYASYDAVPEDEPLLSQWIEKSPTSYPARVARGIYYATLGEKYRGDDFIQNTQPNQLHILNRYLDVANRDLVDSLPLTAKPIVSVLLLLHTSKHRDGKQANRMWLDYANRIDSNNYGVRRQFMTMLTPRWGGSYDEMWAFLKECQDQRLPAEYLRVLESHIYLDQAETLCCEQRQLEKGLPLFRKAVAMLDGIDTRDKLDALKGIVSAQLKLHRLVEAGPEIEDILRIAPHETRYLGYRGWVRFKEGRFREGLNDYSAAAELGDAYAQLQLGLKTFYGVPSILPKNHEQALIWLKKAADQGNKKAQEFLSQVGYK